MCNLPALPRPLGPSGGVPEYDASGKETGRALITKDWLAEVYVFASSTRAWIEAAAACMEAR